MAILTAAVLKASREAREAGVDDVSDTDATEAIARAEATLNRSLGYKVANADASLTITAQGAESLTLPQRVRTITSVTDAYPGGSPGTLESGAYAIRGNGFWLYRSGGWRQDNSVVITGTFGYASTDDQYVLAKEFVTKLAVRSLAKTDLGSEMPAPGGAYLTGYVSEGASFQFFTPQGDTTGYQDLDLLLDQIGKHPSKGKSGLYTIQLQAGTRDITFDDILAGRETPENSL